MLASILSPILAPLLLPYKAWWANKQNQWMRKRIAAGPHLLGKRSIFIMPTRQGLYLAFFLLAMLLACINYNLSLGYMLTFFVFSVAIGAMHRTHQNLLGTRITAAPSQPVFAGVMPTIELTIENPSGLAKYALTLAPRGNKAAEHSVPVRLASNTQTQIALPLPAMKRGIHPLPPLEISSAYPLGLWRAWSYMFPQGSQMVYPEPMGPLPQLLALPSKSEAKTVLASSALDVQGDAVSHIESSETAGSRTIYWPALAKGQLAQRVLENDTPIAQGVLLSLAGCSVTGLEAQLSQLCFAIKHCASKNIPFVLELRGVHWPETQQESLDAAHVAQCLSALASYE